ncbi:hypothetical protein IWW48_002438 [Coemansia sp. RSA 1200]|nr:hypothetical protein IWW48_002438 [Coemansia sp. RSA 1200]
MVKDFDIVHDPKDISLYAGILLTSYHFLRILTVMYWGILSDRIGRRPVVLFGLLGDLLTFALFGISKSFTWAVVVRCLNGLFTGSSVVVKPMAAEISDDTNRARVMAMLPLMWHLGTMIGGAIGGLLVDPVENYPWLFGNSALFREYPYLLPCLVGSSISLFGLVLGFFKLEETLIVKKNTSSVDEAVSETTPLVSEAQREEGQCQIDSRSKPLSKLDILTPAVIRVLATNTIVCLAIAMHNQLYPIFAATDVADGGLGMDARTIGYTLMLGGILVVYLQLFVYPNDVRKRGTLNCYRHGILWLAVFGTTFPFLSILAKSIENTTGSSFGLHLAQLPTLKVFFFWLFIVVEFYIRMHGDILAFTSVNIIAINVAPRRNYLGFITGLQNQLNSITFMIGPLISGYLWSWSIKHSFYYPFNSHFVWVLSGVALVACWCMTLSIPESVNIFASGSDNQNQSEPDNGARATRSENRD